MPVPLLLGQATNQINAKGKKMKKMLLLATMAVAAIAFAAPAVASASGHFTHEGEPIGDETVMTNLEGRIGFESGNGSVECAASAEASIGTASGTITNLNINTADCVGTKAFVHCKLKADTLTTGSVLTPTSKGEESDIDLNNFKLTNVFETGSPGSAPTDETIPCSVAGLPLELTFSSITLTPDNHAAISSLKPSGKGVLEIENGPVIAEISAFGNLKVAEGQEETIGISTEDVTG